MTQPSRSHGSPTAPYSLAWVSLGRCPCSRILKTYGNVDKRVQLEEQPAEEQGDRRC